MVLKPSAKASAALGITALFVLSTVASVAYMHGDESIRLHFGGGDGFRAMGGHGPAAPEVLVSILEETGDEYLDHLQVLRPFTVFDGRSDTPLLSASVHTDAFGMEHTYVDIGHANITVQGVLQSVPHDEVDALFENVSAVQRNLTEQPLPNLTSSPSPTQTPTPSPTPTEDPDPRIFHYQIVDEENGTRYAVITIQPEAEQVDVLLLETPTFAGLHVTATPWIITHRSGNGTLIELWLQNPVEATVGTMDQPVAVRAVECKQGQCIAGENRELRNACKTPHPGGACPSLPGAQFTTASYGGGPVEIPGTLLHLWANDSVHGGSGIEALGRPVVILEGDRWSGDPFGDGIRVHDADGTTLGTIQIRIPTRADPSLGFTLSGPMIDTLAGEPLTHHQDLDRYDVDVQWGPIQLDERDRYGSYDLLHALVVGTWTSSDGTIRSLHIDAAGDTGSLLSLVEDAEGDIVARIDPIQTEVTYHAATIEAGLGVLVDFAGGLSGPAERALIGIANVTTGEIEYQIRVIEDSAGCTITTLGCLTIVLGPIEAALDENGINDLTGAPPPSTVIGDLPVDGETLIAHVNGLTGTVLAYVPDLGPGPLACSDPATLLTCLLSATPGEILGAATGFIDATVPAFSVVADETNETIGLYDGSGAPLAAYRSGTLQLAGATARPGTDPLITIGTPTGQTLCIRHTFDAAAMQEGAWPSIEAACDGIGGQTHVVQPGARYVLGPSGTLAEMAIHHPADGDDLLFYYHDDGTTTTIATSASVPVDPVVTPSTFIRLTGNPITSPYYHIGIIDQEQEGRGTLQGVTYVRDAWLLTERQGRTLLPGTASSLLFDVTHGPDVDPWVSDGRTTITKVGLGGDLWLSGLRTNQWTVEAAPDAPERLDLVYRIGQAPDPTQDARVPFDLVGFNATSGQRTYTTDVPATQLSQYQSAGVLHFSLAWTTRLGPLTTTIVDDHTGSGYRYQLDTDAPSASVTAPATTTTNPFTVQWSGSGESGSGITTYHIESQSGNAGWNEWIGGRHITEPTQAQFYGTPGSTYHFRAKACDRVANCGDWSTFATTTIASAAPSAPGAPQITVLAPADGATVSGFVALAWQVTHDAATQPIVNVAVQKDGTAEWVPLYSGHRTSATWNTQHLYDGTYTLRYTASDGSRQDTRLVTIGVDNGRPEPALEIGGGSGSGGLPPGSVAPDGETPDAKKGTPVVGLPLVILALLGLVAVMRRRP